MCLKPHLFVPKGVYKLDARVAGRFKRGFKSLEALRDASNARPAVRKPPYELLHFARERLLWSAFGVWLFFFHADPESKTSSKMIWTLLSHDCSEGQVL